RLEHRRFAAVTGRGRTTLTPRSLSTCNVRILCRFLDAGNDEMPRARADGVQKAPRHEVAGSLAPAVPRALWGFDFHAGGDGGRDAGTRRPAWVCAREPGSVQWVS